MYSVNLKQMIESQYCVCSNVLVIPSYSSLFPLYNFCFSWFLISVILRCIRTSREGRFKTRTGIFSTFIGITFERNEIFSWCKLHDKEGIKGFNLIYIFNFFWTFDALNRGRIVFFNGGNDDNLYQNICFDHV